MGLLSEGSPLSWPETKALANHVRKHGIIQFINLYKLLRDRQGDILKWGDEVSIDVNSTFEYLMQYRFVNSILYFFHSLTDRIHARQV